MGKQVIQNLTLGAPQWHPLPHLGLGVRLARRSTAGGAYTPEDTLDLKSCGPSAY